MVHKNAVITPILALIDFLVIHMYFTMFNLISYKQNYYYPTGVNHSSTPLSSLISDTSDQIVLQTLEGHILPLLPTAPSYIHNIHLKLSIIPECYMELSLPTIQGNKGKRLLVHQKWIILFIRMVQ